MKKRLILSLALAASFLLTSCASPTTADYAGEKPVLDLRQGGFARRRRWAIDWKQVRAEAVKTLQGEPDDSKLPLIEKAYATETVASIKESLAIIANKKADEAERLNQIRVFGEVRHDAAQAALDHPNLQKQLRTTREQPSQQSSKL
mgnify:CR=1 FL=1